MAAVAAAVLTAFGMIGLKGAQGAEDAESGVPSSVADGRTPDPVTAR
ncbi:hypothetical protein [Streptomyces sp. NPDC001758]